MDDLRKLAVDALYDARDNGKVMDEAAWEVVRSIVPVLLDEIEKRIVGRLKFWGRPGDMALRDAADVVRRFRDEWEQR